MSRSYSLPGSVTLPNSATLPVANIITGGNRLRLYEILLGSGDAPANQAARYAVKRCSTTGTAGSNPTPSPLDPNDSATGATAGLAVFSVGPTLGVQLLGYAVNQQATSRWVAREGKELVTPTTASNGLCFMNPAVSSSFAIDFTLEYEE